VQVEFGRHGDDTDPAVDHGDDDSGDDDGGGT
jgi:hypothetical protein